MPPKKPTPKPLPKKAIAPKPPAELKRAARLKAAAPRLPLRAGAAALAQTPATGRPPTGERYWEAVGRRKTAVARVRIFTKGDKGLWINAKPLAEYFPYPNLQHVAAEALETMKSEDRFHTLAKVSGGGQHAQAEAIRHGTARALVLFNPDFRKRLKKAGFLTRDPRMKERKKFGLKGARRAPQWAKR